MIFRLNLNPKCEEEVIANVHERTPLIDEIERLVTQDNAADQITGYLEDEIRLLEVKDVECFFVEDEKTYALYSDKKRYVVRKRLYEIESILPVDFIKINKSAIANSKKIARFKVLLSGAVDAEFASGYTECISRRCFAEVKRRFGI
ncbi:MAG: LytTR family transcriptional regulator [Lachnospiraceae bacterium]|nr:LytTR family transcriptional regulator [Lachnospiraceae bacterium]